MSADQIPESTKTTRIYVQWSDDGQFIRKWSREPFADGEPVDAIRQGEERAYRCRGCGWRGSEPIANGHPQNGCDLELMVHDPIATPASDGEGA